MFSIVYVGAIILTLEMIEEFIFDLILKLSMFFADLSSDGDLSSGFRDTVNVTLQACIAGVWWTIFKCKVCESKLRLTNLPVHSESNNILSFLFPAKGGYFF